MRVSTVTSFGTALLTGVVLAAYAPAATIIDDFSGGVSAASHPDPADGGTQAFEFWYDITGDSFATASAGTLIASPALRIDDGGFTNGVYAIYESVVPSDGVYTLSADILVNDTLDSDMTAYQLGVIVNGVHRGPNPSDVATFSGPGTAVGNYTGLNADDLDVTTIQNVVTSTFSASAGDNLLIGFSTDLDTGDFDGNAGFFQGASIDVDNVMLNLIPEPASMTLAVLGLAGLGLVARRRIG